MWRRFTGAAPARLALATALCLSTGAVRADDVDITTSTDDGFVLDNFSGTTATVQTGVTVSNTTFNFNCPFPPPPNAKALAAICASTKAWTLTNEGTIGPADFGDAVIFTAGGSVINFGSIDAGTNGISIAGGTSGTVDNKLGATVHGTYGAINIGTFDSPISGMVTNAGMITSDNQGVGIVGSGTVINLATGSIISHSGSNAVTMVLGTTNIVTNSGLIQSNDAQYGTAVSLDPGTVTNNPGGQILGALTGVWAHGGGSTTVINDGLIDASMADFAFGVPGSAIELDGGGNVTNTGTLQSSSTNSTDAAVYSAGAATVTNSGTIQSLTGGLAIQFGGSARHTLNLDTGSVLGGNVQGGTGTDNLVLMGTGTESIAKFLNFETLSMQGTDWALTGSATFSTSATVDDGLLRVNGDLTSTTVTVMADAVLGGGGTIHGDVGNSGTIAPGNSIGTLTVVGGVTFDTNSLFEVEIDPASGDELVVNGTATIDSSARVSVLAVPGTYADGAEYLILDATTRLGDFGGVIDNSAFLDFALDQTRDPDQVWLIITTVANFADVAETPNQFATAVAIQALDPGNPIFTAIANLDADTARDAFDSLSGEIHPSLRALLLDDSRFIRDAATDRIRRAFADLPPAPLDGSVVATHGGIADEPISLWGRAYGAFGDIEGDGNAATLDRTSGGFFLGGDRAAFDAWRFGFIAGYSHNEADVDARDSSGSIDSAHVALFGGVRFGALGLRFGGAYAWHGIETSRSIAFPGFAATATADYDAATAQAFGEAGYEFALATARIEPFLQAALVDVTTDGFTEKDGAAALSADRESADLFVTTLGLHGSGAMMVAGGQRLTVDGTLGWRHAFGDTAPDTTFAFDGGAGQPFEIAGVPVARNAVRADIGVALHVSDSARLRLGYSGDLAGDVESHGLTGDFDLRF
jgi:outer membrane autotransporter protein